MKSPSIETKLIHSGEPVERFGRAVSMPIFQSSTFVYGGEKSYDDIRYIRLNNTPNHEAIHAKLAALENAEASIVSSSGMASISTALLAILNAGDHFLIQHRLYGGTHGFVTQDLPRWGVTFSFIDVTRPETWESEVRPNTRAIYVESLSNPLLDVTDLKAVTTFAKKHGLISLIDNTFLSPMNLRPIDWGFDLVAHSCTKYLNGHSDIVAGAVSGSAPLIKKIAHQMNHLGGCLDPHAAFLLHRGMKTLALRVRHQNQSALKLARFLESHPRVQKVFYPGLESHPQHRLTSQFLEGCGGVLSFELKGAVADADRLISKLKLAISAPSLGGVETLITRPATTSHSYIPPQDRPKYGVTETLIRVAVGIEAADDLIADFDQALT